MKEGKVSGTTGQSKSVQAIQIRLTGEMPITMTFIIELTFRIRDGSVGPAMIKLPERPVSF